MNSTQNSSNPSQSPPDSPSNPSQSNKCPGCGIEIPSHRQLCGMNGMVCDMDYTTDRYGNIYDIDVNEQ